MVGHEHYGTLNEVSMHKKSNANGTRREHISSIHHWWRADEVLLRQLIRCRTYALVLAPKRNHTVSSTRTHKPHVQNLL